MRFFLLIAVLFLTLKSNAEDTYLSFLKKPAIKQSGDTLFIEHYDLVKLKEKTLVLFKEFDSVIVKTECKMKKGTISRDYFAIICATVSTGFAQGLFQPVFDRIKTVEWLTKPPIKKPDFKIQLKIKEDGIHVVLYHERGKQSLLIPYKDVFITKVNP